MPSRKLPNSTPAVIRTLKTARDAWKNTPSAADPASFRTKTSRWGVVYMYDQAGTPTPTPTPAPATPNQ